MGESKFKPSGASGLHHTYHHMKMSGKMHMMTMLMMLMMMMMMMIALTMVFGTIEGHLGPVQGRSGEEGGGNKRIIANTKRGDANNHKKI